MALAALLVPRPALSAEDTRTQLAESAARRRVLRSYELNLIADGARLASTAESPLLGGSAAVAFTLYSAPLVDDGTPYSLQPYLQRRSSFTINTGLGEHVGAADRLSSLYYSRAGGRGSTTLVLDVYPVRLLALRSELGLSYSPSALELATSATVGVRLWHVRLDAGFEADALWTDAGNTAADNPHPSPQFVFRVRAVLLNRIDVRASVRTRPAGAAVTFDTDYYASPKLGLLIGLQAAHGVLRSPGFPVEDLLAFRMGFSYWPIPALAVTALYRPAWSSSDASGAFDNRLQIAVTTRF